MFSKLNCEIILLDGITKISYKNILISIDLSGYIQLKSIDDYVNGQLSIEITSLNGKLMKRDEAQESTYVVDLSSFQKRVYFITITSKDFVFTWKIIKL